MKAIGAVVGCLVLLPLAHGADGNLIIDPGVEADQRLGWTGSSASVQRVETDPHSGAGCLYVKDASNSWGQANSAHFAAPPGRYYVEAWLRVEGDVSGPGTKGSSPFVEGIAGTGSGSVAGTAILDVQFFDAAGKYIGKQSVGDVSSTEWVRTSGIVSVPDDAATVSLRVLPTGPGPAVAADAVGGLWGACFADDFYFAPLEMPPARAVPMRPHLLVTAEKIEGLLSLAELRTAIKSGHSKRLWDAMMTLADADVSSPPVPGGPRDYADVRAAGTRLLRFALASLVLGEPAGNPYRDAAVAQLDCLFDPDCGWPNWHSKWHLSVGINKQEFWLRHGAFSRDIGFAYDWLYSSLTPKQRQAIIDGLNVYVFPQYHFSANGGGYGGAFDRRDNIKVNNVSGAAILGMSLGQDHPDSQYLIDIAEDPAQNPSSDSLGRMDQHVYDDKVYGPEGSPNESVGYSNAANRYLVLYFDARHYHESVLAGVAGENPLGKWPFPQFCRWLMYMTLPPGRQACLGNGGVKEKTGISHIPAVAAASGDTILQWFYRNNFDDENVPGVDNIDWEKTDKSRLYWYELLRYDPSLTTASPEGKMPRGKIFSKSASTGWVPLSSRTDWNQGTTASVVYGRAGPAFYSDGNYDAGQVCIDGYRQRLIIDQGYRRPLKYHNLLMFDEQNMAFNGESFEFSKILRVEFDNNRGGYWALDTANCYGGVADHVQRTVVHLHPGIVVVHDEAVIDQPRNISLRWHTISAADPDKDGRFTVSGGDDVNLACRVMRVDKGEMTLVQREEEEVEVTESKMTDSKCRILSLFSVFAPGVKPSDWYDNGKFISIATPEGRVDVEVAESELTVSNRGTGLSWSVPLDGTVPLKRF